MSGRITAQIENQGVIRAEDPLTISNGNKTFNSSVGTINTNVFSPITFRYQGGTTVLGSGTSFQGYMALSGTLNLVSDFTIIGQLTVAGQVNGPGTLINISTLRLNGATVNVPVDNRPNGMLDVLSGVNTINGALTTAANSNLQIGGTSTLSVSSGFTNNGTITFVEDGSPGRDGDAGQLPGRRYIVVESRRRLHSESERHAGQSGHLRCRTVFEPQPGHGLAHQQRRHPNRRQPDFMSSQEI